MRTISVLALTLLGTMAAHAAEPSGCDKFKWPIERERAALTAPDRPGLRSGAELSAPAATLALLAPATAGLPMTPERAPKDGTYAGFATVGAAAKPGVYTVSLSASAWIDVVQDGRILKPLAFSGVTDCEGIRKTVKYEVTGSPWVIQISGATEPGISVAVLPAD